MNSNITFAKSSNSMLYNPNKRLDTYYQICQYKNDYTGLYGIRKITFDELDSITRIFEKEYKSEKINRFIKSNKINKYKIYPVNNIKYVGLPNVNDMAETRSELLNNLCKESGYYAIN